ncbi:MAG: hypothetical protein LUH63_18600 [Parabacteroides sp.]|nr:hypothetical protein [Parabacteroides sp.]
MAVYIACSPYRIVAVIYFPGKVKSNLQVFRHLHVYIRTKIIYTNASRSLFELTALVRLAQ